MMVGRGIANLAKNEYDGMMYFMGPFEPAGDFFVLKGDMGYTWHE